MSFTSGFKKKGGKIARGIEEKVKKADPANINTTVDTAAVDAAAEAAKQEKTELAEGVRQQAAGLTLEKFGLGEEDLAARAAERAQLAKSQRGQLIARQGVQERSNQEALQRRIAGQGLRGTGTAEKLAQVAERERQVGEAGQTQTLQTQQLAQEFSALGAEREAATNAAAMIADRQANAEQFATSLISSGMDTAKATELTQQWNEIQSNLTKTSMALQNTQHGQNLKETMRQFDLQFGMDLESTEFNKAISIAQNPTKILQTLLKGGVKSWASGGATITSLMAQLAEAERNRSSEESPINVGADKSTDGGQ
jgi:hypothetical protein